MAFDRMKGEDKTDACLPADVLARLAADFPSEATTELVAVLGEYVGPERIRVIRCIIRLAGGNSQKLLQNIEAAVADYRDVIYWAEYDADDRRICDCNEPFAAQQSVQPDRREDAAPG